MSVWVITGANRGIGLELVRQLVARGDEVIATARRPEQAMELRGTNPSAIEKLDVSDPESCTAFGESMSGTTVDMLFNNAGMRADTQAEGGPLAALKPDALSSVIETNVLGPIIVTQALSSSLAPRASIVNMSSTLGSIAETDNTDDWGYSISKAGLNMHTRKLASEWPQRIVVSMSPGWVKTDMGGPDAHLDVAVSVKGMLQVIDDLTLADSGSFLSYDGTQIPW